MWRWIGAACCVAIVAGGIRAQDTPSPPAAGAPAPAPTAWTVEMLLPAVQSITGGRSWLEGGRTFEKAGCGICHALGTYWQGNGMAPDLTAVGSKYHPGLHPAVHPRAVGDD